jgi:hypothetical protein
MELYLQSPTELNGRHTDNFTLLYFTVLYVSLMVRQPLVDQDLLTVEASRSYSDTPQSVGLLCTSDQPDAEPVPNTQHT